MGQPQVTMGWKSKVIPASPMVSHPTHTENVKLYQQANLFDLIYGLTLLA